MIGSNSDVPSTNFESKVKLENMKESVLGDNKYLKNLNKNSKLTNPSAFAIEERHSPIEKINEYPDKKCAKNLFMEFEDNSIEESPLESSLIPEKGMDETNFLSIKPEPKTSLEKILSYNDNSNPNSDISNNSDYDSQVKNENDESFHTPTKSQGNDHLAGGNLLSSTAKKEPNKSKLHSIFSNANEIPHNGLTEKKFDNFGSKRPDKHKSISSRFSEDYIIIETLGTGNFGTVYKCQNKLDGLIYAIKCTQSKFKGKKISFKIIYKEVQMVKELMKLKL